MITLKNVILRRSAKVLLDGATVTINPGEKVGLVGRNGAGKSTLFALLNGGLHEDGRRFLPLLAGAWRRSRKTCPRPASRPLISVVAGDTRLVELREQLATAEAA